MQSERVVLTYADYEQLPDDGRRYELHQGELSVTPAPGTAHQETSGNLYVLLRQYVKSRGLGRLFYAPYDCILDDTTIVQPDLVFVDNSRLELISSRGLEGAPSLAVEVISPFTTRIDRVRKRQLYARYGVPYYWIVDPEARTVEAYRLAAGQYEGAGRLEGSEAASLPSFEDLRLEPANLWP